MDFGKLDDISMVDFSLPADNPQTEVTLAAHPKNQTNFYVGPPIWSNPEWLGVIYPTNAKDRDLLYYYSRQFNTIELNVTHSKFRATKPSCDGKKQYLKTLNFVLNFHKL